ncbi:hypothetical protein O181_041118 [Austropuccinia psidii MF-1]|uniref:Reverse transcriptase/retrotransposon-derived protein RNase H-like domain-containing protein n=1 Tax=Austropuccinia psidii MF-1 TaxID=1389203 RepID=A0A9Q3DIJ8_9BASI|nr:hypothetical protein [Austropuccinia psidii MF-1]
MKSFLGFAKYYRNHIKHFSHISSILYKLCSKDLVFGINKERRDAYEKSKHVLTNAPVMILPDFELPFSLYIEASCSEGLGASLHQRQIVNGEPREGVICYISRKLKDSEDRLHTTQVLLNMKTTNRHMLRWKIAIQEYRANMIIIYKEGKSHTNSDGLSRWPIDNVKSNPAYDPEVAAKIPIHFMEIDRRKNFRFSEWAPESGTSNSGDTDSEGTETPILGISSSELHKEFFNAVIRHMPNTNSVAYCFNSFSKNTGAQSWNTS